VAGRTFLAFFVLAALSESYARFFFSAAIAHPASLEESHFEKIKGKPSRIVIDDVTIA